MNSSTLDTAGENPRTLSGRERRRSERVPHVMAAWIFSPTATDLDDKTEVTSFNTTRHGVGFISREELAPGSFFMIELGMGAQKLKSEIRIVSSRRSEAGGFEIGAEFW